jgi:hypothetical protein
VDAIHFTACQGPYSIHLPIKRPHTLRSRSSFTCEYRPSESALEAQRKSTFKHAFIHIGAQSRPLPHCCLLHCCCLMLCAGFWPVGVNNMISFLYPLVLASLFLGPQVRLYCSPCSTVLKYFCPRLVLPPVSGTSGETELQALHPCTAGFCPQSCTAACRVKSDPYIQSCTEVLLSPGFKEEFHSRSAASSVPAGQALACVNMCIHPTFPECADCNQMAGTCCLLQERESSAALTVFWAAWWPLVMLSFPFVGRAWCAMW